MHDQVNIGFSKGLSQEKGKIKLKIQNNASRKLKKSIYKSPKLKTSSYMKEKELEELI